MTAPAVSSRLEFFKEPFVFDVPRFMSVNSPREQEVYELLITGECNKEIGVQLGITTRTVRFHASNIFSKASVNNRLELICARDIPRRVINSESCNANRTRCAYWPSCQFTSIYKFSYSESQGNGFN